MVFAHEQVSRPPTAQSGSNASVSSACCARPSLPSKLSKCPCLSTLESQGIVRGEGVRGGGQYVCCGPCAFAYMRLSMKSRTRGLSITLIPALATAGMPASLWK